MFVLQEEPVWLYLLENFCGDSGSYSSVDKHLKVYGACIAGLGSIVRRQLEELTEMHQRIESLEEAVLVTQGKLQQHTTQGPSTRPGRGVNLTAVLLRNRRRKRQAKQTSDLQSQVQLLSQQVQQLLQAQQQNVDGEVQQ